MKIFTISILFLITNISPLHAQGNDYSNDPQAIYYKPSIISYYTQNYLDNPLFLNYNLTGNSAPQNEPSIRINRTNPNYVVAAWRDFRLGQSPPVRRLGYSYSTNGGITWSVSALLPDPLPNHATQSDPVLTSDNNGYFYLTSTSRDPSNTRGETVVYRSTNFGANFVELATAASSTYFEDKEWITCDLIPGSPYFNNLYITWTRSPGTVGIRFVKSTNGGLNWSAPVVVGDNISGQGSNLAVGTNYFIYVVWGNSPGIKFDKSTNGGTSFGTDFTLSSNPNQIGFPFICVDYSNRSSRGNVYVVWDDNRNGNYDAWFQRSTDAGNSWLSAPIRINDVITNNQYKPAIQCDTNGYLNVVYYDERTGTGIVNSYWAYSTDQGNTWINQRLSDTSFSYISIGSEIRNGEYIGIDAFANKIIPVWTDDRSGSPNQEIYSSNLSILVSVNNQNKNVPDKYVLYQNYPNPFNPSTNIRYVVPKTSFISLKVYNLLGNEVANLIDGYSAPGDYTISFDASKLSSGVYFYTLNGGSFKESKKMTLIK